MRVMGETGRPMRRSQYLMRRVERLSARRFFTLALLLAAACKSGGGGGTPAQDGMYDFVARTGRNDLRGTLLWMSGEASINAEIGYCRADPLQTDMQTYRYMCETGDELRNLVYIIDRRFPLTRSRWRAVVQQTRQRQVCVRYETRNNRQVCVQYRQESYEVSVPVGGPMTFTRRQTQGSSAGP